MTTPELKPRRWPITIEQGPVFSSEWSVGCDGQLLFQGEHEQAVAAHKAFCRIADKFSATPSDEEIERVWKKHMVGGYDGPAVLFHAHFLAAIRELMGGDGDDPAKDFGSYHDDC